MTSELSLALYGAWRLARLDRSGLAFFDRSVDGFWRSFRAALLVYPAFLVMLALRVPDAKWERAGALRVIVVETIGYVIVWVAFPLALVPIARWLDRESRYFDFFVVYNWAQVLETALFLLASAIVQSGMGAGAAETILFFVTVVALLYEWFIARVALDLPAAPAALVVAIGFFIAYAVNGVANGLY